jgi:hypothetical protein
VTPRPTTPARARPVLLLAALLAALAGPAAQPRVSTPYEGVTLIERIETVPRPLRMHIARVDTRAPGIRFQVSPPGGTRETVRQRTLEFLEAVGAQLAINAHFFLPFPSEDTDAWIVGLGASDGRVFSAFETPEQNYALVANAPALNFDPRQRARIVHRDPKQAGGRRVRERVTLWNTVAGSSQIVTGGRPSVPRYRDASHPEGVLAPGGPSDYANAKAWADVVTARTAIGLSKDRRTLTLFTVDRASGSDGMRLDEIAQLLTRDYGVWDALNLDGGGSTTMAWRNPATGKAELLNTPAGTPAGRAVATSLAVFARRR